AGLVRFAGETECLPERGPGATANDEVVGSVDGLDRTSSEPHALGPEAFVRESPRLDAVEVDEVDEVRPERALSRDRTESGDFLVSRRSPLQKAVDELERDRREVEPILELVEGGETLAEHALLRVAVARAPLDLAHDHGAPGRRDP